MNAIKVENEDNIAESTALAAGRDAIESVSFSGGDHRSEHQKVIAQGNTQFQTGITNGNGQVIFDPGAYLEQEKALNDLKYWNDYYSFHEQGADLVTDDKMQQILSSSSPEERKEIFNEIVLDAFKGAPAAMLAQIKENPGEFFRDVAVDFAIGLTPAGGAWEATQVAKGAFETVQAAYALSRTYEALSKPDISDAELSLAVESGAGASQSIGLAALDVGVDVAATRSGKLFHEAVTKNKSTDAGSSNSTHETPSGNVDIHTKISQSIDPQLQSIKSDLADKIADSNPDLDAAAVQAYVEDLGVTARVFSNEQLSSLPQNMQPKLDPESLNAEDIRVESSGIISYTDPDDGRVYAIGRLETSDGRAFSPQDGADSGLEMKREKKTSVDIGTPQESALNALKQGLIEEADVDSYISQYSEHQQQQAKNIVGYLGAQGNFTHFNDIRAMLGRQPKVFSPGDGGIGDTFAYLANEKSSFQNLDNVGDGTVEVVRGVEQLDASTVILLDESMLNKLESDEAFRTAVKESGAQLLRPGASLEVDPLSGRTPQTLDQEVKEVLALSEEFGAELDSPEGVQEMVDLALNAELDQRLNAIGFNPADVQTVYTDTTGKTSVEIAESFNPGSNISVDDLTQSLEDSFGFSSMSKQQQELLLRYITESAEVYSPAELTQVMKTQHDKLVETAAQKGIAEEDIVYVVPRADKSYGMVSAMYQRANPDTVGQFVSMDELTSNAAGYQAEGKMVVVLDDIAGSGKSLDEVRKQIRDSGFEGELAISPTVASRDSMTGDVTIRNYDFPGFDARMDSDPNFHFEPGNVNESLDNTDFYSSLSRSEKAQLRDILGSTGYGDQGLLVVFPYMAPNNNAIQVSQSVGQFFTLNGRGIKGN